MSDKRTTTFATTWIMLTWNTLSYLTRYGIATITVKSCSRLQQIYLHFALWIVTEFIIFCNWNWYKIIVNNNTDDWCLALKLSNNFSYLSNIGFNTFSSGINSTLENLINSKYYDINELVANLKRMQS